MPEIADLVSDSPATYISVAAFVTLDAIIPIAPSETLLVAGGILVADGELSLALLMIAAVTGALAGHSVLFVLGARFGPALRRRLFSTTSAEQRVARASETLRERTWLLIVADFLPAGRTAAMFAAGGLGLAVGRFYAFIVPGAFIWAGFYIALGYAGGSAFETEGLLPFAVSLGAAFAIAGLAEAIQRLRHLARRHRR
ncbi:MAG: DedA family protein [Solirubrobacterales bacterium]